MSCYSISVTKRGYTFTIVERTITINVVNRKITIDVTCSPYGIAGIFDQTFDNSFE